MTLGIKVDDFLSEVYRWLMCHQRVQDEHQLDFLSMGKITFIKELESFMEQRFVSMHPDKPVDRKMLHECAVEYAREFTP